MTVQLEIRDGNPYWYLSPDIWVVPGTDPNGPPGTPVVGRPAYVWARVANHGFQRADRTRVDFWWSDPSGQILRSTAHKIGSAFADLAPKGMPGSTQDVLCLAPWHVSLVNKGHECLIVAANHTGSSVPEFPPDPFSPLNHPEIAQKNMTVIDFKTVGKPTQMLTIASPARLDKTVLVEAFIGGELDEKTLWSFGLMSRKPAVNSKVEVGLSLESRCVTERGSLGQERLEIKVPSGTRIGVHVAIRSNKIDPSEYVLINVVERQGERVIGGYGYIVADAVQEERK